MISKKCSECKNLFPYSEFYLKKGTPDGYSYYCYECTSNQAKRYYNNKNVRKKAIMRSKKSKQKAQIFVLDYLSSHPCIDCGEKRIPCLEFDHLNDKKYHVSYLVSHGYSIKMIKEEIEKCVIRCANCHHMKTSKQFGWYSLAYSPTIEIPI